MTTKLVVHTGASPDAARPIEEAILAQPDIEFVKRGPCASPEEVLEAVRDADAAICNAEPYDGLVFAGASQLKGVVRTGVGVDTLDLSAATEHGVICANFPEFCTREVANHAIVLLLDCAKKVTRMDRTLRRHGWNAARQVLSPMGAIHGQTLGLLAFGNIARATATRAQAFGLEVIAYDPFADPDAFAQLGVESVSLDELARRSDYVSCHIPANPKTMGMLDAAFFRAMQHTAYFINTSRGAVVNQPDLVVALQAKHIAGAALDVFEYEPLPADSPLMGMENVVLSPHTASFADATFDMLFESVAKSALLIARGELPEHVANPDVLACRRV